MKGRLTHVRWRHCELGPVCRYLFVHVQKPSFMQNQRTEVGHGFGGGPNVHKGVGRLDLHCQMLLDPEHHHSLLVFTAYPRHPER
jgi:hypothetical protein